MLQFQLNNEEEVSIVEKVNTVYTRLFLSAKEKRWKSLNRYKTERRGIKLLFLEFCR